jgi:5-hydroxyisourate hydrolase
LLLTTAIEAAALARRLSSTHSKLAIEAHRKNHRTKLINSPPAHPIHRRIATPPSAITNYNRTIGMNVSSHVLDTASGLPGKGIQLSMFYLESPESTLTSTSEDDDGGAAVWTTVGRACTNQDGRAKIELPNGGANSAGVYKMVFYTKPYFESTGTPNFYPKVDIIFRIADPAIHYHVPLLISPFGYSTYKGS